VKAAAFWRASRPASSGNRAAQLWLVKWTTHGLGLSVQARFARGSSRSRSRIPENANRLPPEPSAVCRTPSAFRPRVRNRLFVTGPYEVRVRRSNDVRINDERYTPRPSRLQPRILDRWCVSGVSGDSRGTFSPSGRPRRRRTPARLFRTIRRWDRHTASIPRCCM